MHQGSCRNGQSASMAQLQQRWRQEQASPSRRRSPMGTAHHPPRQGAQKAPSPPRAHLRVRVVKNNPWTGKLQSPGSTPKTPTFGKQGWLPVYRLQHEGSKAANSTTQMLQQVIGMCMARPKPKLLPIGALATPQSHRTAKPVTAVAAKAQGPVPTGAPLAPVSAPPSAKKRKGKHQFRGKRERTRRRR